MSDELTYADKMPDRVVPGGQGGLSEYLQITFLVYLQPVSDANLILYDQFYLHLKEI